MLMVALPACLFQEHGLALPEVGEGGVGVAESCCPARDVAGERGVVGHRGVAGHRGVVGHRGVTGHRGVAGHHGAALHVEEVAFL